MPHRRFALATALAGLLAAVPAAAQHQHEGQKPAQAAEEHDMKGMMQGPWKELNAFHHLLHESHHPLMQSGDLAPARQHAAHLAEAAAAWAASGAPEACAGVDTAKVAALAAQAKALADLVAGGGADADVKAAVDAIHDGFKPLNKACRSEGMKEGMKKMKMKKKDGR
jgi:hypothetical protein